METNCSNSQLPGFSVFCGSFGLWMFLAVFSMILVLSLCGNIFICSGKLWGAKRKAFLPHFTRSLSLRLRDMEDNPIYGNITYAQTTEANPPPSAPARADHKKKKNSSQGPSGEKDCYANLKLKVPRPASGRSSPQPQIQYSDVTSLPQAPLQSEPDPEESQAPTDTVSLLSDLYASVDAERNKTRPPDTDGTYADTDEAYANHV